MARLESTNVIAGALVPGFTGVLSAAKPVVIIPQPKHTANTNAFLVSLIEPS